MRKSFLIFLLILLLISSFFPIGCQTASNPSPPNKRITSFLGVDLGMTKTQVDAILGDPELGKGTSSLYYYQYISDFDCHSVSYDKNGKTNSIGTTKSFYSLKGMTVGNSRESALALLGTPDKIEFDVLWIYNTYGIQLAFLTNNGGCWDMRIYSGDR